MRRWRFDKLCGRNSLPDGSPAECDPDGDAPCCNGWKCGSSTAFCNQRGTIDYRRVRDWREAGILRFRTLSKLNI